MTNSHITITTLIVSIIIVPIESISRTVLPYQKKVGGVLVFFLSDEGSHTYIYYINRRIPTRNRLL